MSTRHIARVCGLTLMLGLAACASDPVSVAGPAATGAPVARASVAPAQDGVALGPKRPPVLSVPANPTRRAPAAGAPLPAPVPPAHAGLSAPRVPLLAEMDSPDGVPFVPVRPVTPGPVPSLTAAPGLGSEVTTSTPGLPGPAAPIPLPAPAAPRPALSVPSGLYLAGGYNGTATVYTAAMRMRGDGTYSMSPSVGGGIPDPTEGRAGTYEVLSGSSLRFLTGPFAGSQASVIPDYEATGDDFIDVTHDGVFLSFRFVPA